MPADVMLALRALSARQKRGRVAFAAPQHSFDLAYSLAPVVKG
ncbi:hypothetical protein [Mycobacterium sp. MMS18-G62]